MVITEPSKAAGKAQAVVAIPRGKETKVFALKSVENPDNGDMHDPIDAERRGIINKIKGVYMNPVTGKYMSIKDAILKGHITAEEVHEPDYDELPEDVTTYATVETIREKGKILILLTHDHVVV